MKTIHSPIFGDIVIYKNFIVHSNIKERVFKINSPQDLIDFSFSIFSQINAFERDYGNPYQKLKDFREKTLKNELELNKNDKDVYLINEIVNLTDVEKILLAVGSTDLSTLSNLMKEPANIKCFLFRNPNASSLFKSLFFDLLKEDHDSLVAGLENTIYHFKLFQYKSLGTAITPEQARELFDLCDDYEIKFYLGILFNFEQVNEEVLKNFIFHNSPKVRHLGRCIGSKIPAKFLIESFLNENLSINERIDILDYIKENSKELIDYIFTKNNLIFYRELAKHIYLDSETIIKLYQIYDPEGEIMRNLFLNQFDNPNTPDFLVREALNIQHECFYYSRVYFIQNHFDKIDKDTLNKIIAEKKVGLIRVIAEQLKKHPEKKDLLNWFSKVIIYSKICEFLTK